MEELGYNRACDAGGTQKFYCNAAGLRGTGARWAALAVPWPGDRYRISAGRCGSGSVRRVVQAATQLHRAVAVGEGQPLDLQQRALTGHGQQAWHHPRRRPPRRGAFPRRAPCARRTRPRTGRTSGRASRQAARHLRPLNSGPGSQISSSTTPSPSTAAGAGSAPRPRRGLSSRDAPPRPAHACAAFEQPALQPASPPFVRGQAQEAVLRALLRRAWRRRCPCPAGAQVVLRRQLVDGLAHRALADLEALPPARSRWGWLRRASIRPPAGCSAAGALICWYSGLKAARVHDGAAGPVVRYRRRWAWRHCLT
jgi:hypothetical protein